MIGFILRFAVSWLHWIFESIELILSCQVFDFFNKIGIFRLKFVLKFALELGEIFITFLKLVFLFD